MTAAARIIINEVKGYHNFLKFMIVLVVLAVLASAVRFIFGLGATTNMNDTYPWGLWISFDVVTAVPLAAGAFTLGAIVSQPTRRARRSHPLPKPRGQRRACERSAMRRRSERFSRRWSAPAEIRPRPPRP